MKALCADCGRDFDGEYMYCPWCGTQRESSARDYLDMIFERYSRRRMEQRQQQFRAVEKQLDELEQELNVLVLSAEMHK